VECFLNIISTPTTHCHDEDLRHKNKLTCVVAVIVVIVIVVTVIIIIVIFIIITGNISWIRILSATIRQ